MKKIFVIIFIHIIGYNLELKSQTLNESLKMAAENNPLLKAKYLEFEAALQKVTQVNSLPDPNLSLGYFISPVETRVGPQQVRIGISQMFPWFGTLKVAGEIYTLQAEAKYEEFIQMKNEIFMQVKSAWYPIYEANQKIKLQNENLSILNTYKQLATIGFKNDKNAMVDVIRVDIMIENTETEIKLIKDQVQPLTIHFNQLLNREDTIKVNVEENLALIEVPENYRKDSLLINHPILKSIDLKIKSAEQMEALSAKQGLPKLGVGLDYVFVGERTDMNVEDNGKNIIMPMISMSIPIYRNKYKAAVKEALLNQEVLNNYKVNMENNLVSNYTMSLFELEKSKELILLYQEQITKTKQAILLLETAYSNSGKDFVEILRMQQELLKYQISVATSIKTFYIALAKLDYLTSKAE